MFIDTLGKDSPLNIYPAFSNSPSFNYVITLHYYSAPSPLGFFSDRLHQVLRLLMLLT
jgi:hypothetical protein